MEKLTKKYGLLTAICMVVGIVIGSGVFFKAGKVLSFTNGNIGKTLAVVAIVGGIMISVHSYLRRSRKSTKRSTALSTMRKRLSERDMHTTSAGLCRRFIIRRLQAYSAGFRRRTLARFSTFRQARAHNLRWRGHFLLPGLR